MSNERLRIEEICSKASSNLAQKQLGENRGCYPVFGASGFIQNIDSFHQEHPYIGIVKDGSGVGRVNIYPAKSSLLGTMQYIIPKSHCDLVFLAYALKSLDLSSFANGAAIPHIYFKDYGKCVIPVPPLAEQKRIVEELDLLSGIIEKQKQQLKELDTLAQSIFYDMFGDPVTNEKGWEKKQLKDLITEKLSYGSGASGMPYDGKIRYIRITDIDDNGKLKPNNMASPSKYDSKYLLKEGDILFARSGATVGKSFFYTSTIGSSIYAGYLIRARVNQNIIKPVYLYFLTLTQYYKDFIVSSNRGVAQPNVNATLYGLFLIPLPPLPLQNLFAEKIEAIEKQKEAITKSIEETQKLFDYTMDKYFG